MKKAIIIIISIIFLAGATAGLSIYIHHESGKSKVPVTEETQETTFVYDEDNEAMKKETINTTITIDGFEYNLLDTYMYELESDGWEIFDFEYSWELIGSEKTKYSYYSDVRDIGAIQVDLENNGTFISVIAETVTNKEVILRECKVTTLETVYDVGNHTVRGMPASFNILDLFSQDDGCKNLVERLEVERFTRRKERSGIDSYNEYSEINNYEYPDEVRDGDKEVVFAKYADEKYVIMVDITWKEEKLVRFSTYLYVTNELY